MEFNEGYLALYGVIQVGVITPLVQWIKKQLPGDFPIQPVVITAVLSFAAAWGLAQWLAPEATVQEIITYALGGHVLSQVTHATYKSRKKVIL